MEGSCDVPSNQQTEDQTTSRIVQTDTNISNVENFLRNFSNTSLAVSSTSLYRTLPVNDALFTQAHTALPWKDQGDITFVCSEGKIVRAHRILLLAILPNFVNDLMKMRAPLHISCCFSVTQLPIFVMGIEDKCVMNFLTLLNQNKVFMTGTEILQMKNLIEVLGIKELSVFIHQPCAAVLSVQPEKRINDVNVPNPDIVHKQRQAPKIFPKNVRDSVLAAVKSGKSVKDTAVQFKVNPKTISRWKYSSKRREAKLQNAGKRHVVATMPLQSVSLPLLSPIVDDGFQLYQTNPAEVTITTVDLASFQNINRNGDKDEEISIPDAATYNDKPTNEI